MEEKVYRLWEAIRESQNICVFTGAGISCPSGIPDFRSADGLYNSGDRHGYSPEEIISHSFFMAHPEMFFEFYKSKMLYPQAKPNLAHLYFARLEGEGKQVSVVTQNIDGLHQAAGSSRVMELHGSVHRNRCMKCGKSYSLEEICAQPGVPRCPLDGGIIKPEVVLYEEPLDSAVITRAVDAISRAQLLVVVGTSLTVYPAAGFVEYFQGETLALLNKSATPLDGRADIAINRDITELVRELESLG
jgi:NAD-dependent deacetylase